MKTAIVWFRRDLRITDNTALNHAVQKNDIVIPAYIFTSDTPKRLQTRRTALLLETLRDLDHNLRTLGSRLIFRHGKLQEELSKLIHETNAHAIFWNMDQEPFLREQENSVLSLCEKFNISAHPCKDSMLHHPFEILKPNQQPYTVFTPYYRQWIKLKKAPILPAPRRIFTPRKIHGNPIPHLRDLKLTLSIPLPPIGEKIAHKNLKFFISKKLNHYASTRNFSALDTTSKLSIPLNFGSISIRTIFHAANKKKS